MDIMRNNCVPGDQRLIDQIVYELKSQGIFDQFRKECIADVDTKPAYQNLRQRVEGSVTGFLKKQTWKPDMNKNQVREMLRKNIYESGFLETGVERIVDQVVNPKINSVFLPQVEDVVYRFLGIEKPHRNDESHGFNAPLKINIFENLLPTDLEAVSPESDIVEEKCDKLDESAEADSKVDEDESPPFEPLEGQNLNILQEDNSIDSHLSGFSGLASHDSNHSHDVSNQDSQLSKPSSESHMSISMSDEDSQLKSIEVNRDHPNTNKTHDKSEDKKNIKSKTSDKQSKSSERKDEKDRRKDHKDRHSSSKDSKSKDKMDSKSDAKIEKNRSGIKHQHEKDKERSRTKSSSSSSSKHRSHSKKEDVKEKSKSSHNSKHVKSDKHHSSTHKDKKDSKKDLKKDDHFSSKNKKHSRRSTDRDSNDGHSGNKSSTSSLTDSMSSSQTLKQNQQTLETTSGSGDSGNSDGAENDKPSNVTEGQQRLKIIKPKFASNIHEAKRLMKIRKQLNKIEKQNQMAFDFEMQKNLSVSPITVQVPDKCHSPELISPPLQNSIITKESWDALEAKLNQNLINVNYNSYEDYDDYCVQVDTPQIINCINSTEDKKPTEINAVGFQLVDATAKRYTGEVHKDGDELCGTLCECFEDSLPPESRSFLKYAGQEMAILETSIKTLSSCMNSSKLVPGEKNNNGDGLKRKRVNNNVSGFKRAKVVDATDLVQNGGFTFPLSPVEVGDKSKGEISPGKSLSKKAQRYSSDDLYKPRPLFSGSRRRFTRSNKLE